TKQETPASLAGSHCVGLGPKKDSVARDPEAQKEQLACCETQVPSEPPEAAESFLDLIPEFFPRILRIELGEFPQQFFRLFIARHRHRNLHFDNLVAPHSI